MEPGSEVYLSRRSEPHRRLRYTWELVRVGKTWVGINTAYPNLLVSEAIQAGIIRELRGYPQIRREVWVSKHSRLDLCLQKPNARCYVEVKSVTLANDGVAAFPDAVTVRGTKHLKELIRLRKRGEGAALVFVVQRADCSIMRPADEIDSEYGVWLRKAVKAGVKVLAYVARVSPQGIILTGRMPIKL
jgi:sugar fermentation stimulation protein A